MTGSRLGALARSAFADALSGASSVALLMAPTQSNPGDSAIWCGTRQLVDGLGLEVRYTATYGNFDPDLLQKDHPTGPVILRGGGNVGDVYPTETAARLRALRDLPGRRIIQAPQSVWFSSGPQSVAAAQLSAALRATDCLLFTRETASTDAAREALGCEPVLSPDHALVLSPDLSAVGAALTPESAAVALLRTDGESHGAAARAVADGVAVHDWPGQTPSERAQWPTSEQRDWLTFVLWHRASPGSMDANLTAEEVSALTDRVMRARLDRAVRLCAKGHVVITDRLHGALLAWMLGRTVILLPNRYHKNRSTYETWFEQDPRMVWADTIDEAFDHVRL